MATSQPGSAGSRPAAAPADAPIEALRIRYAFWLSVFGLGLAGALVIVLALAGWNDASEVAAVVGLFTSVLGTLVGAFFGFQVGVAGKESAERASAEAHKLAQRALAALPPEQARPLVD